MAPHSGWHGWHNGGEPHNGGWQKPGGWHDASAPAPTAGQPVVYYGRNGLEVKGAAVSMFSMWMSATPFGYWQIQLGTIAGNFPSNTGCFFHINLSLPKLL